MTGRVKGLVADIPDLEAGDPLEFWRWVTGEPKRPTLVTALGDVFLGSASGEIYFLDTYEGHCRSVAANRSEWQRGLEIEANVDAWFTPWLVHALRLRGLHLAPGECYSPSHPLILGGKMEPGNFEVTNWRLHIGLMGQIYRQSRDLPEGTVIRRFVSEEP